MRWESTPWRCSVPPAVTLSVSRGAGAVLKHLSRKCEAVSGQTHAQNQSSRPDGDPQLGIPGTAFGQDALDGGRARGAYGGAAKQGIVMRWITAPAVLLSAAGSAAASGGLSCEVEDKSVRIT